MRYERDSCDRYACCCCPLVPKVRQLLGMKKIFDTCNREMLNVFPQNTRAQLLARGTEHSVPVGAVLSPLEVLSYPGIVQADIVSDIAHSTLGSVPLVCGALRVDGAATLPPAPSPRLGEHTEDVLRAAAAEPIDHSRAPIAGRRSHARPLDGIKVLDLTWAWAGPYATKLLARLGADVLKVEAPHKPDMARTIHLLKPRSTHDANAPYFLEWNTDKRGVCLDITTAKGRDALLALAAHCDVLVENWAGGVAAKNGLTYAALKATNPKLVVLHMPAFPEKGPDSARQGFASVFEAFSGITACNGYAGAAGEPHRLGINYGDACAAIAGAGAVMMGLLRRQRDPLGHGCDMTSTSVGVMMKHIGEISMASKLGLSDEEAGIRRGNRHPRHVQGVYRCADDSASKRKIAPLPLYRRKKVAGCYLALTIAGTDDWEALLRVVDSATAVQLRATLEAGTSLLDLLQGTLDAAARGAVHDRIDEALGAWARRQDHKAAATALQEAGVMASAVLSPMHLAMDHHVISRQLFTRAENGENSYTTVRVPWDFEDRPIDGEAHQLRGAPTLGQHSREVLLEAGLSEAAIAAIAEEDAAKATMY